MIRRATDADFNAATRQLEVRYDIYFDKEPLAVTPDNYLISGTIFEEGFVESENPLGMVSSNEFTITLFNTDKIFSPSNERSPYFGKIRIGMKIIPWMRPTIGLEEWDLITFSPLIEDGKLYFEFFEGAPAEIPFRTIVENGKLFFESEKFASSPFIIENGSLYYYPFKSEVEWIQQGEFYVTDWTTALTESVVNVKANDKLYKVLNAPTPDFNARFDVTTQEALRQSFSNMGYSVIFHSTFDEMLAWSFIEGSPSEFISEMCQSIFAICYCDRKGDIVVKRLSAKVPLRTTWTEDDQIMSISLPQSIIKTFDGTALQYSLPQLSHYQSLLDLRNITIEPGTTETNQFEFNQNPVVYVETVFVQRLPSTAQLLSHSAGTHRISFRWANTSNEVDVNVRVVGTVLDLVTTELTDNTERLLQVTNRYIQDTPRAEIYKQMLEAYVAEEVPTVTVEVRGNPLIEIGDKVRLVSPMFEFDFTGIVIRINSPFTGGYRNEVTLLNEKILEGAE